MATFTWKTNGFSGAFETAANWNPAGPPGAADEARLTATGTYTVTTTASDSVNSLQTAAGATLAIGGGLSFSMANGTESVAFPTGANAGVISLANNSTLFVGGTVNNTSAAVGGGIVLNGSANITALRLSSATTTFTGGGKVVLGTGGNNQVYGNAAANTLVNVNNTFSGVGNIGVGQMTLSNQAAGVINADQTAALTLQVNGGVTNTGLLEATNTGGLFVLNTGITNTGGTIGATGAGAHVDLQNSSVAGGSLTSGVGAQVDVVGGQAASLIGTAPSGAVTVTSGSNLNINNAATLNLTGTLNNVGTVNLLGVANVTVLRVGSAAAPVTSLTGGGQVVLGTGGNNQIYGTTAANVLDNVNNTISGVGNVGAGQLTLVNETAGTINANQTAALTLQVNGGVTNTGLLESTNTGGLFILNTGIDNEGGGNAGKITATGAGAHVDLQNSTIYGGTLTSGVGAQIDVVAGQSGYLYGADPGLPVTITAGTNVNVNNAGNLYLYGAIANSGSINLLGVGNVTNLRLVTPVTTLTGAGQVVLGGAGNNQIFGNNGYLNELDNVDNTISGIGSVGAGQMTLLNETAGVINANQAGQLTVNVNGGVTNTGLLEATNAAGNLFLLNDSIDNTLNSNAGKISATVAGARVDLQNTTVYGGTLSAVAGSQINVIAGQSAFLDGTYSGAPIVIAAGTNVQVNNASNLYLRGVISNNGIIDLGVDAEPNTTSLRLQTSTVTLTSANPLAAGGVVQLSNSANNAIFGNDVYTETLNNINNTIQGSGNIGNGQMTLINGKLGVINANQPAGAPGSGKPGQLVIQVNGGVTNNGLIEASVPVGGTAGGTLLILNTTINQTGGGKIQALGVTTAKVKYGATVDLQNTTIQGGTLISTAGNPAKIEIVAGQSVTLDGTTKVVTDSATFNVQNASNLYLTGLINVTKGTGSINLQAGANTTAVRIVGTTTLGGAGTINMGNSPNNQIFANSGVQTLINTNATIAGAGNIGAATALQIINRTTAGVVGTINANQTTALTLQTNQTVENYGLIESATTVAGAGGLFVLNSNIDNTISNGVALNTGKITATGTGHVDLQNSNIYGGTLTTTGTAVIDVVAGQSAGLNGTVLGQAVNIAAGTNIVANNASNLLLYGAINNAGTITLAGGPSITTLRLASPVVTLSGGGAVVLAGGTGVDQIVQVAGSAELDNQNNTISGGGQIGAGGNLTLKNFAAGTINATLAGGLTINLGGVQMLNAGILEATGSNLLVTGSVFNTGTIIANGGNVTIQGNVNGTGAAQIFGGSSLEIGSSVGGASAQTVTFQSSLLSETFKLDQSQNFTGTVAGLSTGKTIDLANLGIGSASLSYSGTVTNGVLTVTDGVIVSTIKLTGNYTQANFVLSNDGGGHTNVTYNGTGLAPSPAVNQMISAMASLGGGSASSSVLSGQGEAATSLRLATPHAA